MTPEERVHRLVKEGSVAADEGERLLAAMKQASARSLLAQLFNPFERFGGGTAAVIGAIVSIASLGVSRLGVRFDGLLDLHFTSAVPPLRTSIAEQIACWIVPALCFWGYARTQSRHVRLIDFVGSIGLARLPLMLAGLVLFPLAPSHISIPPKPTFALLALVFLTLGFVAANITLLYNGFKNSSGLKGTKLVAGFVGLLIVGEALSKVVLLILS